MSDAISNTTVVPVLAAYGVTHAYGSEPVLREVSVELFQGEILAVFGPNGCGKSTLLKIMSGLIPARSSKTSAQIRYRGEDFSTLESSKKARSVAYVAPDLRAEFPMTVWDAVMMGRRCHGSGFLWRHSSEDRDAVHSAMELCFCWGLRARELHTLSGGERQLVVLARALAQEAKVLLLDESLSRMDLNHQAAVGRLLMNLASKGFSILLVAHDLNLASEWASHCLLMKKGEKLASGPIGEVLTADRIHALYPDSSLVVGTNPVTGTPKIFFSH